ncbi:50S ribosomal protein L10 [Candidatus Peregrinibacteria bacterium HGW-Peregrinibacteria-1]|jgi:large subunit ribosomal protein L10|nr:MAG: 50S ribosomal protein L10 [Candidatus Peregrinibacteria bacterium HGW-Peregrinibacteria-1]
MPLNREQKAGLIQQMADRIKAANAVVFADYQGLSVSELDDLRAKLREHGVKFQVAKKTLIKRAATEAGFSEIPNELLEGPVGSAFSAEDGLIVAKTLYNFAKEHEHLKLRGALFEGRVISLEETKALALLPGREELVGKFIYLIKSPISGFHGVLNNTLSGFVRALNAIREKKEVGA